MPNNWPRRSFGARRNLRDKISFVWTSGCRESAEREGFAILP
jgi:hypothetical protein